MEKTHTPLVGWMVANLCMVGVANFLFAFALFGVAFANGDYAILHQIPAKPLLGGPFWYQVEVVAALSLLSDVPALALLWFGRLLTAFVAGVLPYVVIGIWTATH